MGIIDQLDSYKAQVNIDVTTKEDAKSIAPEDVGSIGTALADIIAPYLEDINNIGILSGSGVPSDLVGENHNLYFQSGASIKIYKKSGGAWILVATLPIGYTLPDGPLTLRTNLSNGVVTVTPGGWVIDNIVYQKLTQTQFTISDPDLNYYRIDLIYAEDDNTIHILEGTPSVAPVAPELPDNSIAVDYVTVPSSASLASPYLLYGGSDGQETLDDDTGIYTFTYSLPAGVNSITGDALGESFSGLFIVGSFLEGSDIEQIESGSPTSRQILYTDTAGGTLQVGAEDVPEGETETARFLKVQFQSIPGDPVSNLALKAVLSQKTNKTYVDENLDKKIPYIPLVTGLSSFVKGNNTIIGVSDTKRGGVFKYVASGLTANNGTVFGANGGGFWQRQFQGDVSLSWFGAIGDGSNESTVIQNAIDNSEGQTLNIPYGTYFCNNINGVSNIRIKGDGTLKVHSSAQLNDVLLEFIGCENFDVSGITLDGNKGNVPGSEPSGIALLRIASDSTEANITNVKFQNSPYGACILYQVSRISITDCRFFDTDCAIITFNGCSYINIDSPIIKDGTSEAIVIYGGSDKTNDHHINISNVNITNKPAGILLRYVNNFSITGGVISGCSICGIGSYDIADIALGTRKGVISGVTITDSQNGIVFIGTDTVINAVTIDTVQSVGISLSFGSAYKCKNVTISNCIIKDVSTNGSNVAGMVLDGVSNCTLIGNKVLDTRTPFLAYTGISVSGGSENTFIANDVVQASNRGLSVVGGTNAYLVANKGTLRDTGTGTRIEGGFGRSTSIIYFDTPGTTNIALTPIGDYFKIDSNSTAQTITSIDAGWYGRVITLHFKSTFLSLNSTGNLRLKSNFTSTFDSAMMLAWDGTNWIELTRNPPASIDYATLTNKPTNLATTDTFQTISASKIFGAGFSINGAAGSARQIFWTTATVSRWVMQVNGTAEAGANVGSDFEIIARDDSGALLSAPLRIYRSSQNVVVGDTLNDYPTSKFTVNSSAKGVLIPRMSATQRDAISSPAQGLLLYNTTNERLEYYNPTSAAWRKHISILSSITPANGQLLIGNATNDFAIATLTAGTGIIIANGSGSITISATGGGQSTRLTANGDGVLTTITIAHGLTGVTTSSIINVGAKTADASGITYFTADATNIYVHYAMAPAVGTGNLVYDVIIK